MNESATLTEQDICFITTHFKQIAGWCHDDAAYVTCSLLTTQERAGHAGDAVEIGVYQGKYLSLLYHRARECDRRVLGIDIFRWSLRDSVMEAFRSIFGSTAGLELVTADSAKLNARKLLAMLGGKRPAFVSVDGAHDADAVARDLALADEVLAPGGLVALDDFLNPRVIGVSEGAYRVLARRKCSLQPFLYAANKLFLCRSKFHTLYRNGILGFVAERPELPVVKEFQHRDGIGHDHVEQPLFGTPVLIF